MRILRSTVITAFFCVAVIYSQQSGAQGTAFTYQGQLLSGSSPANGSYDLQFTLYSVNAGGVVMAGPVTNSATVVSNGLFTAAIDFGPNVFTGSSNWLDIAVRTNGTGTFVELAPREQVTTVPYASFANVASNVSGTISSSQLTGAISVSNLPVAVVTNNETGVALSGTFGGNGANLTGLNPAAMSAGTAGINISGNAATATLASNVVSGISITNPSIVGVINGNGGGLTNLYASQLVGGSGGNVFIGTSGSHTVVGSDANTAMGNLALSNNVSGTFNTAIGANALLDNYDGSYNTAEGTLAMQNNIAGDYDTAVGNSAMQDNTNGIANTAIGNVAMFRNMSGSFNTAMGQGALFNMPGGSGNTALGYVAGTAYNGTESSNIDLGSPGVVGENNTIHIGNPAIQTNTFIAGVINGNGGGLTNLYASQLVGGSGGNVFIGASGSNTANGFGDNTAIGYQAFNNNTFGINNTANGANALLDNLNGNYNTANGTQALQNNTAGSYNTAIGNTAMQDNTNGNNNTAVGNVALFRNTSGSFNTAMGQGALFNMPGGSGNTALGYVAGTAYNGTESSNIDLGSPGVVGENNTIHIGNPGIQTNAYIAGVINGNGGGLTNLSAAQVTGAFSSLTDNGSIRVGTVGTTISNMEMGQATMPPSSTVEATNFLITFPQAFSSTPKITASISFGIQGASDVYAICVSSNSTTAFRVNVMRLDVASGWGQNLLINWQAWQ